MAEMVSKSPMAIPSLLAIALLLFSSTIPSALSASSLDSPCADQLQRCGSLVEEFERQLLDLKNLAFRSCFTNTACVHEKIAFDDCFAKSLQAVRAPFGENAILAKNDFLAAAEDFRPEMEQCFAGGSTAPAEEGTAPANGTAAAMDHGEADISHLPRAVFGIELVDRLWGLPNGDLGKEKPLVDPQGGCQNKDAGNRVFGGGISRIVPPGADQLTNLNTSCTLTANELACYRRALDHDPQYRLLMSSWDRTMRSCIQNARLQSGLNCQFGPSPQLHSCICNARQELDTRMQSAILSCVHQSPVAQLYAALVGLSNGGAVSLQPLPDQIVSTRFKPAVSATTGPPMPGTSLQISEEPLSLPSTGSILTQGTIVSGQCLCACPQKCQSAGFSASNDFSGSQTRARLPAETAAIVVPAANTQTVQQQTYRPVSAAAVPWYYQPLQTALSAEAGIANGFERFFNGQPPLRRKKREGKEKGQQNGGGRGQ